MIFFTYCVNNLTILVCQKIIQNVSTKQFSCNICQRTTENEIKFAIPVVTKTVHLHNKEMETTNLLKVNVSQNCVLLHHILKQILLKPELKYIICIL